MINPELRVSQTYRSRFLTQLPKVDTGTKSEFGFGLAAVSALRHRDCVPYAPAA
jgi:hypothetical protein